MDRGGNPTSGALIGLAPGYDGPHAHREAIVRHAAEGLVDRFERGAITRRELIAGLIALGAATRAAQALPDLPPPIDVSGVDHVALRVRDVERSTRFYTRHLGASVRSQSSAAAFLDLGAHWLALFGLGQASTSFGETPPGVDHISFHSTRARSLEERMNALGAHGLDPTTPPGSGRVYFKDPDGVILQLS
jgi:catechol 2,3-dioxygenase-like lactoylglutathione lyase family enzyme